MVVSATRPSFTISFCTEILRDGFCCNLDSRRVAADKYLDLGINLDTRRMAVDKYLDLGILKMTSNIFLIII